MFFDFIRFIIAKIVFFCSSIGGDGFPKPLSPDDEAKYLKLKRRYACAGNAYKAQSEACSSRRKKVSGG